MNLHMNWASLMVACLITTCACGEARAEKVPLSKAELEETATHIVVGKVQAIYSRSERKGGYQYTHYLAEVQIEKLEKGEGPQDLICVRYFDITWKGPGQPPPGPGGHSPRPAIGESFRLYLARNAYDGFTRDNDDGGYNVIYGNGVQPAAE